MDYALTPNTSALLSYLSTTAEDSSFSFDDYPTTGTKPTKLDMPTSLPPSAFFNMARPDHTPELTPESSNTASESPEGLRAIIATDSDEDGVHYNVAGGGGQRKVSDPGVANKRKAGHGHTVQEEHDEDEDESGSDDPNGHEDKRAHGNDKASSAAGAGSGRRGGRKSAAGEGKEVSKAAKRKEQNRKAQTAFRERREAKVKDLEEKIEALESKSYGAAAENENLRGILKRLQEENVALKQAAFTFAMPVNGNSTPVPNAQNSKPHSPPLSSVQDQPILPHRSSSGMIASPESLVSVNSGGSSSSAPSFDNTEMFNTFAIRPEHAQSGVPGFTTSPDIVDPFAAFTRSSSSSFSPLSPQGTSKAELDALWASFYPNGTSSILPQTKAPSPVQPTAQQPSFSIPQPSYTQNPNNWSLPRDAMAFRDQPSTYPPAQTQSDSNDWSNLNDDSINDFLASLTGSGSADQPATDPLYDFEQADDFNAQLQKLLEQSGGAASPSAAFNLSPTGFSPGAYLNLSPSPIASGSGSADASPGLARQVSGSMSSMSNSNSASPQSDTSHPSNASTAASSIAVQQPEIHNKMGQVVHIVGTDGKRLKPSEVWTMMGMHNSSNVNDIVIDDLCDQMKSKATCKADGHGGYDLSIKDAEAMFKWSKNAPRP